MAWQRMVLLGVVVSLLATPCYSKPGDEATAEALFRLGREAFAQGDYREAMQRFQESYRFEQTAGTLLNWAICEEKLGYLAAAWQRYRQVLEALPSSDERVSMVRSSLHALERRLPWLRVAVQSGASPATTVTRDGNTLSAASLGVPLPVDPGNHVVIASAPDHRSRRYVVTLTEGERKTLEVAPEPEQLVGRSSTAAAPAAVSKQYGPQSAEPDRGGRSQTTGYVFLGVGAVSLAVGAVTGALALDRAATVREECVNKHCSDEGLAAGDSGLVLTPIAITTLALAVVSAGVGGYLVLSADSRSARVALRMSGF